MKNKGFSLIEILVSIAIIGLISTITFVALGGVREKSRDTKRKNDIAQIGRFLALSCYEPNGGNGIYDLADLIDEIKVRFPQAQNFLTRAPRDPKIGNDLQTFYFYEYSATDKKCALYANLENQDEPITLLNLSSPTPGGGQGVLQATTNGPNNTSIYFQYSN